MSSVRNSFKTKSECTSNGVTASNKTNVSANVSEKSINLNEFLDFLNLSCRVNDMISHNNEGADTSECRSSSKSHNLIDFQKLYDNRLINDLYGFNRDPGIFSKNLNDVNTSSSGVSSHNTKNAITITANKTMESTINSKSTNNEGSLHSKLNEKLDYVLNEGILDAVIPFICPIPIPDSYTNRLMPKKREPKDPKMITSPSSASFPCQKLVGKEVIETASNESSSKIKNKLTTTQTKIVKLSNAAKKDPEVIIHVCDEVANTSKDFLCPQSLLVSKMGYFADVTAGQKLEDMDISVHCDIQIFEWLMKWVQSENSCSSESGFRKDSSIEASQNLNVNNVIPILVSASFLKMEPLLLDCLSFCHSHLGEVVKVSANLSCLNDTVITRMAAMFTNVELEMVCDKKDRLLPRLWTKLICSLFEPDTEALRGHYYSLAGLFKCAKCQKYLTNTMQSYIQCTPSNIRLNRWGQIVSHHVRDPSWNINHYISQLFRECKSWRLVYWKLWGHAHYLYCYLCEMYFPVYQMSWCRYHPEQPSFLGPAAEGCTSGPVGRYACCGQQTFRYETLPGPQGCQFREHSVLVETDRERSILSIVQLATEGKALGDLPSFRFKDTFTNGETTPRWLGMSLMPQRCHQGLLPVLNLDDSSTHFYRGVKPSSSKFFTVSSTETESTDTLDNIQMTNFKLRSYDSFSTSSSDGCESSENKSLSLRRNYPKKQNRKSKPIENPGRYWSGELSARSNQDHQRDFEEKIIKQIMTIVQKKTGLNLCASQQNRPLGGTYVKLEQEWKEQLKQRTYILGQSSLNIQLSNNYNNSVTQNVKSSRKKGDTAGGQ